MNTRNLIASGAIVLAIGAGIYGFVHSGGNAPPPEAAAAKDPGALSAAQIARLGIRTEPAVDAGPLPLGTVPGVVSLPPEARVAVAAPFAGTALRVLVLQGQEVTRGQPLAVVRAAEPVQFGAELARAEAELAVTQANAARLSQLAREGIVAPARAEEAQAALARTRATIRENRRLLALGGAGADGTATLRAPIAGRIATVGIQTGGPVGSLSGPASAPFVIENAAALSLDLQVPERLAAAIRPGMAVQVALPATDPAMAPPAVPPPVVAGSILSIGASLDPASRSVPAKASIASAPGSVTGLVPGKGVMAVIRGLGEASGLSVPSGAVTRSEGQDFVFVRSGGPNPRFARRKVVVAAEAGGRSVISSGLNRGEAVAVSGIAELKSLLAGQ